MAYTEEDLKIAFEKDLDKDGDGWLSYSEMRDVLIKGNPTFNEKDLRLLWRQVDSDRNDRVEFDEFVDFIAGKTYKKPKEKWKDTFMAYSGFDDALDQEEFLNLCIGCGFLDDSFGAAEVEDIFKKVCKPGDDETKPVIGPKGFSKAMARIAKCKGEKKKDIEKIIKADEGPSKFEVERKSLLDAG